MPQIEASVRPACRSETVAPSLRLHAVHELEHVAFGLAREAVEEAFGQVNTTARPLIVVEGAAHLGLVARANEREAVVEKHGTEISTSFEVIKVDAMIFRHGTYQERTLLVVQYLH